MKITRKQLRQIIKEELSGLDESNACEINEYAAATSAGNLAMKMIVSEIDDALKQVDSIWKKYFNFDGMPNEASMLDDNSRKMLEKFKMRSGPHYSTRAGKALMLDFLLTRITQQATSEK